MVKIVQNCISLKNVKTNKKLYCKVKTKVKSVRIGENYLVFTYFSPSFHLSPEVLFSVYKNPNGR